MAQQKRILQKDLPAGIQHVVQVRAILPEGPGPWSRALVFTTDGDVEAPAVPTNVVVTGLLRSVLVHWDFNDEPDFARYELHASTTSGFAPDATNLKYTGHGNFTSFDVNDGETWYVKIRAIDTTGNASAYSAQVSGTSLGDPYEPDTDPPGDVTMNALTSTTYYHGATEFAKVDVSWVASGDADLAGYIISYRETAAGVYNEIMVGPGATSYSILGLKPGVLYEVRMKAVDGNGNISDNWSAVQSITPSSNGGAIQQPVELSLSGAIQSDVFVAGVSGFRIDNDSIEVYGTGTGDDVSFIMGSDGLNMNSFTDQMWFGATTFANATWRVGTDGVRAGVPGVRIGSDVTDPETNFYMDTVGNIWSGNDVMASAPWEITAAGAARFNNISIAGSVIGNLTLATGGHILSTGFDLSDTGLALTYGTIQLGVTGFGANVIGQIWSGGTAYATSTTKFRVGADGDVRIGGNNKLYVEGATGNMWSGDATMASASWEITGAGAARFGNITITSGTVSGNVDVSGIFTLTGATAKFRTSSSGKRVEFNVDDTFTFHDGGGRWVQLDFDSSGDGLTFTANGMTALRNIVISKDTADNWLLTLDGREVIIANSNTDLALKVQKGRFEISEVGGTQTGILLEHVGSGDLISLVGSTAGVPDYANRWLRVTNAARLLIDVTSGSAAVVVNQYGAGDAITAAGTVSATLFNETSSIKYKVIDRTIIEEDWAPLQGLPIFRWHLREDAPGQSYITQNGVQTDIPVWRIGPVVEDLPAEMQRGDRYSPSDALWRAVGWLQYLDNLVKTNFDRINALETTVAQQTLAIVALQAAIKKLKAK